MSAMKRSLSAEASRLLDCLVSLLPDVIPGEPRTYIGYRDVHLKLGLPQVRKTYGESLKAQGLLELAQWTLETGAPGITGIIVDTTSLMPGPGYFFMFGKDPDDFPWWKEQVERSKTFDWVCSSDFVDPPDTQEAHDLHAPPERNEQTTYRILRDTALARRVKALHRYECQICGQTLTFPDGTRYAEAHHIQPLGRPHDGPDAFENILCLCPNHHAELDYGIRPIDITSLNHVPGHSIGTKFVEYHNTRILRKAGDSPPRAS